MKRLEKQLKALQDHLTNLSARAAKARGQTRRRLKRLERRTRVKVERTVRTLEPKVRQAVAEGYTRGMKTAISIPDEVFAEAERLARRLKKSRSELYSHALREYVARHGPEYVTETLDRICGESPPEKDFVTAAARRTLRRSRW